MQASPVVVTASGVAFPRGGSERERDAALRAHVRRWQLDQAARDVIAARREQADERPPTSPRRATSSGRPRMRRSETTRSADARDGPEDDRPRPAARSGLTPGAHRATCAAEGIYLRRGRELRELAKMFADLERRGYALRLPDGSYWPTERTLEIGRLILPNAAGAVAV